MLVSAIVLIIVCLTKYSWMIINLSLEIELSLLISFQMGGNIHSHPFDQYVIVANLTVITGVTMSSEGTYGVAL